MWVGHRAEAVPLGVFVISSVKWEHEAGSERSVLAAGWGLGVDGWCFREILPKRLGSRRMV